MSASFPTRAVLLVALATAATAVSPLAAQTTIGPGGQGNATYQRLVVAQENYDKIMMKVNDWIVDGIKKGATSSIITLG